MTSTRPYLLRAFYEWICDNAFTPYLVLNTELPDVTVPKQYIQDGQIILNISPGAVTDLDLSNDWVIFQARFSGVVHDVSAPMQAVLAIYAKENGQGVVFSEEETAEDGDDNPPAQTPKGKRKAKPNLRVVK
jgi:stringent starvation protein B